MKDTGIWFHPSGILGASPGGIVDHETVLEVRCPYTERNLTIEEAAKSETFCLEKTESGQYALRKHHVYWHQVQGEMYFTHRKFGYFVVWTTKDVAILRIEREENWAANIPRLTNFTSNTFSQKQWKENCSANDLFKIFNLSNGHNSGLFLGGGGGAMVI